MIFGCHINHSDKNSTPTYCFEFVVHLDSSLVSGKKKRKSIISGGPFNVWVSVGDVLPKAQIWDWILIFGIDVIAFLCLRALSYG